MRQINKISHDSWNKLIWTFLSLFYFLLALITDIWLGPQQKEIQATHFGWRPTLTFIVQLKEPLTSPLCGHCVCHGRYDSKGKRHTISTKRRMKCVILHFMDKNNVLSLDTEMVQAAQEGYHTFQNPSALETLLNEWNLLWGPWLNDVWNIGGLGTRTFSYNLRTTPISLASRIGTLILLRCNPVYQKFLRIIQFHANKFFFSKFFKIFTRPTMIPSTEWITYMMS